MAKVTIDATAHIKTGVMTQDTIRDRVLDKLGANDTLLKDLRDYANRMGSGHLDRKVTVTGVTYFITVNVNKQFSAVLVSVSDDKGDTVGTAIFGFTKFFSCVADNSATE